MRSGELDLGSVERNARSEAEGAAAVSVHGASFHWGEEQKVEEKKTEKNGTVKNGKDHKEAVNGTKAATDKEKVPNGEAHSEETEKMLNGEAKNGDVAAPSPAKEQFKLNDISLVVPQVCSFTYS